MLYISISDSSIELIQTKKTLFKESIIACGQKDLPAGIIKDGIIQSPQDMMQELQSVFSSAYPHPVQDSDAVVAISDGAVVLDRVSLPKGIKKTEMGLSALQEVKVKSSLDPLLYENFYKILGETSEAIHVLYAAMTKDVVTSYLSLFQMMHIRVRALTSRSFALYETLFPLLRDDQTLLFCTVRKSSREYFSIDAHGPLLYDEEVVPAHESGLGAITRQIKALEEMQKTPFTRMIIGGDIPDTFVGELSGQSGLPVETLSAHIAHCASSLKITMDTGGKPLETFAFAIGVRGFLSEGSGADFSQDRTQTRQTVLSDAPSTPSHPSDSKNLLEQHRFIAPWMLIGICGLGAGAIGAYLVLKQPNFTSASTFFGSPTATPTVTTAPSLTPTPTIDRTLKKSDLKLSIQNGTEKSGYAKEIGDYLEKKEYAVKEKTNADNKEYTQTVIRIKSSKRQYLPLLKEDLSEKFQTLKEEELPDSAATDAVIILGEK